LTANIHSNTKTLRVLIAGGGTGGHIFPAIAIAQAILRQQPGTECLFVGAKGKMEMEKIPAAGFRIEGLDIAGFNRSSMLKNWSLPFKLVKSFFQVRAIIKKYKPDAVIGVGGYSSFPVLKVAQTKSIPTFIHESNSFAGKSNILLGKKAVKIFVASEGMEKFFPAQKIIITGNPVRNAISKSKKTRTEGIEKFGLNPAKKTILSVGGSLGAKTINEAIGNGLNVFEEKGLQLIWQTGKPYAEQAKQLCAGKKNIWTGDFIKEMEDAFAAADIVVSRAGAMAIAELCICGKPAILVPYPHAAEDHQTANAMNLVNREAALMVKDAAAMEELVPVVTALAADEPRQQKMKDNIMQLGIHDADERIAKEILQTLT
jgi:UDP-N-acetylglucosamine--N-acetylmuramyl-(pentapeptide) pyrophosphoryl-undecaprenol N-acetylglucosamine transferase